MADGLKSDGHAAAGIPSKTFHDLHGFLKGKTNGRLLSIEDINEAIAEACVLSYLSASSPSSGLPAISPTGGEIG